MLKLAADENFNNDILRGLARRVPGVDLERVQDSLLLVGAEDPDVLEWAAGEGRLLLTHDVRTMTRFAMERAAAGLPMPGIVEIPGMLGVGEAIESLVLLTQCSIEGEWEGQIIYLPFK